MHVKETIRYGVFLGEVYLHYIVILVLRPNLTFYVGFRSGDYL